MNIFTANQVNHVYVVTGLNGTWKKTGETDVTGKTHTDYSSLKDDDSQDYASLAAAIADGWEWSLPYGNIEVNKDATGENMYFAFNGEGGLTRSDLIPIKNIMYGKKTTASAMQTATMAATIKVNSAALSSDNVINGQDYILNLEFQNPIGMSPDSKYIMTVGVHAAGNMSQSTFYQKLKEQLDKQLKKMGVSLIETSLVVESSANKALTLKAAVPDWELGLKQQKPIVFNVLESVVTDSDKQEIYWIDVTYSNGRKITGGVEPEESVETTAANIPAGNTIDNGKLMADYEYFYMGERADQYRKVGWPNYIDTKYMVDPTHTYDTIGIHYAYTGANHAVQKSEKDVTLIIDTASSVTSSLVSAINTAVGAILLS